MPNLWRRVLVPFMSVEYEQWPWSLAVCSTVPAIVWVHQGCRGWEEEAKAHVQLRAEYIG